MNRDESSSVAGATAGSCPELIEGHEVLHMLHPGKEVRVGGQVWKQAASSREPQRL